MPKISRRSGFTLIELLVALTLGAGVMAIVMGLMTSQGRFVERMDARAQQTERLRSALETINNEVSELTRGSVFAATADSVSYRLPISWGAVCGKLDRKELSAGLKKVAKVVLGGYVAAVHMEPHPRSMGVSTPDGFAFSPNGEDWTYYPVSDWGALAIATNKSAKHACLSDDDYDDDDDDDDHDRSYRSRKDDVNLAPSDDFKVFPTLASLLGVLPTDRGLIFSYVNVTYSIKDEAAGGRGGVLYRSDKGGTDRLAWPFGAGAGFQYRLDDMTEASSVTLANLARVRWIKAKLPPPATVMSGRASLDTISFEPWVPLYNARD